MDNRVQVKTEKIPRREFLKMRRDMDMKIKALQWVYKNYDGLKKRYPDQWVLTDGKQIIAHAQDFVKVAEIKLGRADRQRLALEFIEKNPVPTFTFPSVTMVLKPTKR